MSKDERGTWASAEAAMALHRAGRIDEASDLNPIAIDIYEAILDEQRERPRYAVDEEEAMDEVIWEMFIEPSIQLADLRRKLRAEIARGGDKHDIQNR